MIGIRAHGGLGVHAEEREGEEDGLVAIADVAVAQHADAVRGAVAAQHRRVRPIPQAKKTRGKPEGAGQIVGVRELKERHFAELLHRLPGQAARSIVETEYLQNCELASRNCPSAARIAWGTGF